MVGLGGQVEDDGLVPMGDVDEMEVAWGARGGGGRGIGEGWGGV